MRLGEYLDANKITAAEFARRIGAGRGTVGRWVAGKRRPEWPWLEAIARETGGAVSPDDFLSPPVSGNGCRCGNTSQGTPVPEGAAE